MEIANTVMWSASELLVVAAATMVFFFCLGFSLWKALSVSQTGLYWHISLCMIWLGIIIAVIARSQTEVWTVAIDVGYAMLSGGVIMSLAGAVYLGLYHLSFHRAG